MADARQSVEDGLWEQITNLAKDASFAQATLGQIVTDEKLVTDLLHRMRHTRVMAAIALQLSHYTEVLLTTSLTLNRMSDKEELAFTIHTKLCERLVAEYEKQGLKDAFAASPLYQLIKESRVKTINAE